MRRALFIMLLSALAAYGCGTASDDFEAGNRLSVVSLVDSNGLSTPKYYAVEKTDDSGADGELDTGDEGEGDGLPTPGEVVDDTTLPTSDTAILTVRNEPRPGVGEGAPIVVERIDVTYYDRYGRSVDLAPPFTDLVGEEVASGQTADIEFVLSPYSMKVPADPSVWGLRSILLLGTPEDRDAVRSMRAVLDIYARDWVNDDEVHIQTGTTVYFVNGMVETIDTGGGGGGGTQ